MSLPNVHGVFSSKIIHMSREMAAERSPRLVPKRRDQKRKAPLVLIRNQSCQNRKHRQRGGQANNRLSVKAFCQNISSLDCCCSLGYRDFLVFQPGSFRRYHRSLSWRCQRSDSQVRTYVRVRSAFLADTFCRFKKRVLFRLGRHTVKPGRLYVHSGQCIL